MAPDTNPLAASTLSVGAPAEKPYADRHILIVEDEPTVSQLVSQAIQRNFGCNIQTVSNGDAALEAFDPALHDAIVTDMNMPGIHGLELISALRNAGHDVGIIVMTGLPNEFPYVKVVQAGANDFLHKPFQPAELHAKILRILRERDLLQEQQRAQKKYRSLFELSGDGMVMMNGTDYRVLEANPAFEQFSGKSEQVLCEQSILECFAARDRMRFEQWLSVITRAGKGTMADLVVNREDGVSLHVDVSVTVIETEKEGLIYAAFKDITDRRETQDRLAEQAQKDELTGLHNKRSFHSRIEGALARARQGETSLSLFLIDLDNFKACNDTHGHQIGDKLLVQVGQAVRKSIRVDASDMGFRFGGDEFAVMLAGANAEGSVRVAERIQQEFGKNETYGTTMSIGVALYEPSWSKDELIRHADDALYKAKGQGKNAVALAEVAPA